MLIFSSVYLLAVSIGLHLTKDEAFPKWMAVTSVVVGMGVPLILFLFLAFKRFSGWMGWA